MSEWECFLGLMYFMAGLIAWIGLRFGDRWGSFRYEGWLKESFGALITMALWPLIVAMMLA